MTLLGWAIVVAAYCAVAVAITLARKSTGTRRQASVAASIVAYVALASLGFALAFESVPEGVASALVSLAVTLPLLGIRSPR